MKYGLANDEFEGIVNVIKKFPQIEKAMLFGSRALGTENPGSDVDIAIYGKSLTFDDF